jgi:hypothetical protein
MLPFYRPPDQTRKRRSTATKTPEGRSSWVQPNQHTVEYKAFTDYQMLKSFLSNTENVFTGYQREWIDRWDEGVYGQMTAQLNDCAKKTRYTQILQASFGDTIGITPKSRPFPY